MEPSSGRLPGPGATRPHMEPGAAPLVERRSHVLVGVTGSVAALKLPLLVSALLDIPGVSISTRRARSLCVRKVLFLGPARFCVGRRGFFFLIVDVPCGHRCEGSAGIRPACQRNWELGQMLWSELEGRLGKERSGKWRGGFPHVDPEIP